VCDGEAAVLHLTWQMGTAHAHMNVLLGRESMKGKSYSVVILAATVLLTSAYSFSRNSSKLPEPAPPRYSQQDMEAKSTLQPLSILEYIVRRGDSLSRIGRIFGTTSGAIKTANGLTDTKILIGQKLQIPVLQGIDTKIFVTDFAGADPDGTVPPRCLQLVQAGFKLLGVRYRWSGGSEKSGFDCSGLVKNLFARFDIDLPHSSKEQYKLGEKVERNKLEMGDLVFFTSGGKLPNHVGIYVGSDKFLHAARKAHQVIISDLNKRWYDHRYLGARRLMD
jgi:LysM repeat protein